MSETVPQSSQAAEGSAPDHFRHKLSQTKEFCLTFEIGAARGARGKPVDGLLQEAEKLHEMKLVDCFSLTDNLGGVHALSPDILGQEMRRLGASTLVHFSTKDKNRNFLISRAYQLDRMGQRNVLALTGDAPVEGHHGLAMPVFDLDSVALIKLLDDLNAGVVDPEVVKGEVREGPRTDFFIGAAVSPFKRLESEQMTQYYKLERKLRAGAHFVVTQLGYDMRKYQEVLKYLQYRGLQDVPVIADIYVLTGGVARTFFHDKVPGCVVSQELFQHAQRMAERPQRGKALFHTFAAQQIAVLKGLGFRGVHISGFNLKAADVQEILQQVPEFASEWPELLREVHWPRPGDFYLFVKDEKTGLNDDTPVNLAARPNQHGKFQLGYRHLRLWHNLLFAPGTLGFRLMRRVSRVLDRHPFLKRLATWQEGVAKRLLVGCRECGDCALPDLAYLCPLSSCTKDQRNGPCGGSNKGMCEVYPDRECLYVRVYDRLKLKGETETLREAEVVFRDHSLDHTCSWINYFLGRDHQHVGEPQKPPQETGYLVGRPYQKTPKVGEKIGALPPLAKKKKEETGTAAPLTPEPMKEIAAEKRPAEKDPTKPKSPPRSRD